MKQSKTHTIAFRISEKNRSLLQARAKRADVSVTDYLTAAALGRNTILISDLAPFTLALKTLDQDLQACTDTSSTAETLANIEQLLGAIYYKLRDIHEEVNAIHGNL